MTNFVREKDPGYGDLDAWKSLADAGSDVQPHSDTHCRKFSELSPDDQVAEIKQSIEFVKQMNKEGPYVFCYPWNDLPSPLPNVQELSASGFHSTRLIPQHQRQLTYQGSQSLCFEKLGIKPRQFQFGLFETQRCAGQRLGRTRLTQYQRAGGGTRRVGTTKFSTIEWFDQRGTPAKLQNRERGGNDYESKEFSHSHR